MVKLLNFTVKTTIDFNIKDLNSWITETNTANRINVANEHIVIADEVSNFYYT